MVKIYTLHDPEVRRESCIYITSWLPAWFGIPEANEKYAEDAKVFPALTAESDGQIVGLLVYNHKRDDVLNELVTNIHWLGILPEYHRKGIGTRLIQYLCEVSKDGLLTVETLDPCAEDVNYLKTYRFYQTLGFETYHRFSHSIDCPMVKMALKFNERMVGIR